MVELETVRIDLPPELARELRAAVESGEYENVAEVIRAALRHWRDWRDDERPVQELRRLVQQGADGGDGLDADRVFARLRARFDPNAL